jgi:hypothetical protein
LLVGGYTGGLRNLIRPTEVGVSVDAFNSFGMAATPFGRAATNDWISNVVATKWVVTTDALCGSTELTLLCTFWRRGAIDDSAQWLNFRADDTHSLDVFASTSTTLTFGADWAGAWNGASQQTVTIGDGPTTIVAVIRQDGARFFCNGSFVGTKSGSSFSIGTTPYAVAIAARARSPILLQSAWKVALSDGQAATLSASPYRLFSDEQIYVPFASGGATDYPVTATDALTLSDTASNVASLSAVSANALALADAASNVAALSATATDALTAADSANRVLGAFASATDALTLADSASNVAAFSAASANAMTLADSASNVAALSATATDALALADTLNASTSGDYTATSANALTLADSASNVAALGASVADALSLADTINGSASGDYVVVATDALALSDTRSAAFAAVATATDALTLADAINAALSGQYTATATDALSLSDTRSNAAALSASITAALTLAELVSALNSGNATALLGIRGAFAVQHQLSARREQIQTGRRRN